MEVANISVLVKSPEIAGIIPSNWHGAHRLGD